MPDRNSPKRNSPKHALPGPRRNRSQPRRERLRLAGSVALASVLLGLIGLLAVQGHGLVLLLGAVLLLFAVIGLGQAVAIAVGLSGD